MSVIERDEQVPARTGPAGRIRAVKVAWSARAAHSATAANDRAPATTARTAEPSAEAASNLGISRPAGRLLDFVTLANF